MQRADAICAIGALVSQLPRLQDLPDNLKADEDSFFEFWGILRQQVPFRVRTQRYFSKKIEMNLGRLCNGALELIMTPLL